MSERYEAMRERVRALYERNRQQGTAPWARSDYDFVCPSMGTYPFQWFWDSCFHAVALAHCDVPRAMSELRCLLFNQQPDGFIGHVTFWQRERFEALLATYGIAYRTPHLSDCIQPPVLAEAVRAVVEAGAPPEFLAEVLPATVRYFDWLDRMRDPDQDGLIAVLQADETGLDHSPKFDRLIGVKAVTFDEFCAGWEHVAGANRKVGRDHARMFAQDALVVEDVMVNVIYAINQQVLSNLLARSGDTAGAARMRARADRTKGALLAKCYDRSRGLFWDLSGHTAERWLTVNTFTSLMPLALPDLPADVSAALVRHLEDPAEYAAPYPVPTVAMNEPTFVPGICAEKLVWRGPTWMNSNWYLARGLRAHGRDDLARRVVDASAALVERSGFREYYDPHTGEGHGAEHFAWSALVLDMLARDQSTP